MTYYPELHTVLKKGISYDVLEPINIRTLLSDPNTLPMSKPPLGESVLRNYVLPNIKDLVENESVKELIAAKESGTEETLVACLQSCDVYYPRIMSAIFASSPTSLLSELLRKFETSASIFTLITKLTGKSTSIQMLRTSIAADMNLQLWRFQRLRHDYLYQNWFIVNEPWCPTQLSDQLRRQWGRSICGVTMPPNQHLIRYTSQEESTSNIYAIHNHFTYTVHTPIQSMRDYVPQQWTLGDTDPFLGYKTRLGLELPTIRVVASNPLLIKVQNLIDLLACLVPEGRSYRWKIEEEQLTGTHTYDSLSILSRGCK